LRTDAEPFPKLEPPHSQRVADRPDPALGRHPGVFYRFERLEALVEPLARSVSDIFFHIAPSAFGIKYQPAA
jgi:hypothetical protein